MISAAIQIFSEKIGSYPESMFGSLQPEQLPSEVNTFDFQSLMENSDLQSSTEQLQTDGTDIARVETGNNLPPLADAGTTLPGVQHHPESDAAASGATGSHSAPIVRDSTFDRNASSDTATPTMTMLAQPMPEARLRDSKFAAGPVRQVTPNAANSNSSSHSPSGDPPSIASIDQQRGVSGPAHSEAKLEALAQNRSTAVHSLSELAVQLAAGVHSQAKAEAPPLGIGSQGYAHAAQVQPTAPTASANSASLLPQIETLIENLANARESSRIARADVTIRHPDFGAIAVGLERAESDLRATLTSRDPGFGPAAQNALIERAIAASSDNQSTNMRGQDTSWGQGHGSRDQSALNQNNHRQHDSQSAADQFETPWRERSTMSDSSDSPENPLNSTSDHGVLA